MHVCSGFSELVAEYASAMMFAYIFSYVYVSPEDVLLASTHGLYDHPWITMVYMCMLSQHEALSHHLQ
jgi:hypothetical protein